MAWLYHGLFNQSIIDGHWTSQPEPANNSRSHPWSVLAFASTVHFTCLVPFNSSSFLIRRGYDLPFTGKETEVWRG